MVYLLIVLVVFKFVWVVNRILEIVVCAVDVWFDTDRLDDVNNAERRDAPWLVCVVVDVIWGRPDV